MNCRSLLWIAVLLLTTRPALAEEPGAFVLPPELDRYIADAVRDWGVPGVAIAIVKDDQVVAARGYGVREIGKSAPMDGETVFDIASLTKSFTAAGAAVLVDDGKLAWDARVREILPRVSFADPYLDHEVTLRDLLSHRTGLQPANAMARFTGFDREEVLRRVRHLEPQAPFRTTMVYSNILYTVAGEMTGAVAGLSWAELIRRRLIEPAGMRSTTVEIRPSGPNVASPHATLDGVQRPSRPFDWRMLGPSASIYTNAVDLARWLRLQLGDGVLEGKRIISSESMAEMHSPQVSIRTTAEMRRARLVEHFPSYGLGWQVMDYRGEPMHWHSGNSDGMPCHMALLPKRKLGLAVMINTSASPGLSGALANRIMDTYLGVPPRDWSGEALARYRSGLLREAEERKAFEENRPGSYGPGRSLADYAGTFEAALWGDLHVRLQADSLTLQIANGEIAGLSHWNHDVFLLTWHDPVFREFFSGTRVVFSADQDDRIVGLSLTVNRDEIEAERR
jgi:CubicO group peptidase (beta-lactamase class C family)